MLTILIQNATIIDGTGAPGYIGCVGIHNDKIEFVSPGVCEAEAETVIDGTGLLCCPGFIDCHSHADMSLTCYPETYSLTAQGITTFVGGNCGIALAPASDPAFIKPYFASLDLSDVDTAWQTFGEWLDYMDTQRIGANYVPLCGLNPIRGCALGPDWNRPATPAELDRELGMLDEALSAGAFGMSLSTDAGVPGHTASATELETLFKRLEKRESFLTMHTRHHQNQWPSEDGRTYYGVFKGYKGEVLCGRYHGLLEFMEHYKKTPGLRVMTSHITNAFLMPQPHSRKLEEAMIEETLRIFMDEPLAEGYDVYANLIPASQSISTLCTVLYNLTRSLQYDKTLRPYFDEARLLCVLGERNMRDTLKAYINSGKFKMGMLSPATDPYWSDAYEFVTAKDASLIGKTPLQVARERMPGYTTDLIYNNVYEVLFDIVLDDPGVQWALARDKREYLGFEKLLSHPRTMPMTDTIALPAAADFSRDILGYGQPPVAYSMFVRFLIDLCRDNPVLTPEEAVRRISGLPADVLRIPGRGYLAAGNYADVTLLSFDKLAYVNDFTRPTLRPEGIVHVLLNGRFAMRDGEIINAGAGRVLRR